MKSLRRHGIRDITKVRETTKRERSPERDKPALRRDRWRKRAKIDALKSVPCTDCGGLFIPYVMDFDHREGEEKLFNISAAIPLSISFERVLVEAAKCDVVCANCHRMRTWKRMERDRKPIPMPSAPQTCCPKGHSFSSPRARGRHRASPQSHRRSGPFRPCRPSHRPRTSRPRDGLRSGSRARGWRDGR